MSGSEEEANVMSQVDPLSTGDRWGSDEPNGTRNRHVRVWGATSKSLAKCGHDSQTQGAPHDLQGVLEMLRGTTVLLIIGGTFDRSWLP